MASRLIANLIVAGGSVLLKAATQAYRQALINAQRSGVAQEAASKGAASMFSRKTMTLEEARLILGVESTASLEEVMVRYQKMFEANEKAGSFYLQSKIHRAKERIEKEFLGEGGDDAANGGEGKDGRDDEGGSGDQEGGGGGGGGSNPNAGRGFAASGVDPKQ